MFIWPSHSDSSSRSLIGKETSGRIIGPSSRLSDNDNAGSPSASANKRVKDTLCLCSGYRGEDLRVRECFSI